jgi:hypothetical protein
MSDMKKVVSDEPEDFSDVPELSLPSTLPSNYEMKVETDILEPVVFSQDFARFTLQKKGFLSHQSKITFSVQPVNDNPTAFFPLNIGVNSLIKRCVLKAGAKTLAETEDFNHLQAYRSAFIAPENNFEREQYLTGRMVNFESEYVDANGVNPDTNAPTFGIKTGMNIDTRPAVDTRAIQAFATIDGTSQLTLNRSPTYGIFLADLFDCFYGFDLPMYMIDDEVHIELHFQGELNHRVCLSDNAGNQPATQYQIQRDECRMLYDTIFYDGETMEKHRQKKDREGGVVFSYVDYRLSKRVGGQNVFNGNGIVQNLGGAGRVVDKVIYGINQAENLNNPENFLSNQYYSFAPNLTAGGAGAVKGVEASVNLFYNDRFEFPTDRTNLATLFSTTATAEGVPLQAPKPMYGNEATNTITQTGIEGRNVLSTFAKGLWWNSVKLMRGERVNNQGINFHFIYDGNANERTLFVWLALKKTGVIKNGRVDCYFQ